MKQLNIGEDAARKKIQHYCAYQERCHSEVKNKLYEMGLYPQQVDALMADLVKDNFLNEERFAIAFAGGRFRMKQWGRVKIRSELKMRSVSDYCIRKALRSITDEDYMLALERVAEKKIPSLKGNVFQRKSKLTQYLLQKGFERELIGGLVTQFIK